MISRPRALGLLKQILATPSSSRTEAESGGLARSTSSCPDAWNAQPGGDVSCAPAGLTASGTASATAATAAASGPCRVTRSSCLR